VNIRSLLAHFPSAPTDAHVVIQRDETVPVLPSLMRSCGKGARGNSGNQH
jgi:hypothetical protein